jgi:D-glycero-alpha-D-manno-heptose-7-phosphate kinase
MTFIISRTPHRVSLFGGSTDHKAFFDNTPSFVVGFAINQYSYMTARKLPAFHDYKSKIVYSKCEHVNNNRDIEHRIVNKVLETLQINYGVEITHSADIPSGGTGASAAFTVGLLNTLQALERQYSLPKSLAEAAVLLETKCLNEVTGYQDAYFAAYGGFKVIKFSRNDISVQPLITSEDFLNELQESCLLIHTGTKRNTDVAKQCFGHKVDETRLKEILELAELGLEAIRREDIVGMGRLIDNAWQIKKSLSPSVSNPKIDDIYNKIKSIGGYGRLIGAGGAGFILAIFPYKLRAKFLTELKDLTIVPFKICFEGSKIIYAE